MGRKSSGGCADRDLSGRMRLNKRSLKVADKPKSDTRRIVPGEVVAREVNLLALSGEIGWKLAVPLLVFMVIGIRLDRANHTTPLFMLLAIGLSLTISVILIARMIMRVGR